MVRYRLTTLLPIFVALITSGLWLWSRQQYLSSVHPQVGSDWPVMWTDYTPVPLELAGALKAPVATFAYPLYHLLHADTPTWELLALLLGVAFLWTYVGFVLDTHKPCWKSHSAEPHRWCYWDSFRGVSASRYDSHASRRCYLQEWRSSLVNCDLDSLRCCVPASALPRIGCIHEGSWRNIPIRVKTLVRGD